MIPVTKDEAKITKGRIPKEDIIDKSAVQRAEKIILGSIMLITILFKVSTLSTDKKPMRLRT